MASLKGGMQLPVLVTIAILGYGKELSACSDTTSSKLASKADFLHEIIESGMNLLVHGLAAIA